MGSGAISKSLLQGTVLWNSWPVRSSSRSSRPHPRLGPLRKSSATLPVRSPHGSGTVSRPPLASFPPVVAFVDAARDYPISTPLSSMRSALPTWLGGGVALTPSALLCPFAPVYYRLVGWSVVGALVSFSPLSCAASAPGPALCLALWVRPGVVWGSGRRASLGTGSGSLAAATSSAQLTGLGGRASGTGVGCRGFCFPLWVGVAVASSVPLR